jgi:tripartite-type tricarboxylate transporter receptor subunit TctC
MRRQAIIMSSTVILLSAFGSSPALSDDQAFFAGREIKLIVGTGAGGGYDTYARLVARFLGKHIAGNPVFVTQTMPGASGAKAVNFLYSVAPKDGSVIATFNNAMPFYQALGQSGIQFKSEELSWLGSLSGVVNVVSVWHTAGVRTIEDAKHKQVIMGATGAGGTMASYPAILNAMLGTKFKIVTGYEGGNSVNLAIERGEIQGRGSNPWTSWKATNPDWVRDKKILQLVQVGLKKDPDLPDVPLLLDLARNDTERQMFEFVASNIAMERPFAAPPRIPSARLKAYRDAFEKMWNDEEFIAEAAKRDMDIDPLRGERVQEIVASIIATPPDIIEKTRQASHVKGATGGAD